MAADLLNITTAAQLLADDLSGGNLAALSLVGGSEEAGAEEEIILYHILDNVEDPKPETILALEHLGWSYFHEGEREDFRGSGFLHS